MVCPREVANNILPSFSVDRSNAGFKVAFKSFSNVQSTSSGFKPISSQQGFTAVPPPPPENLPPLPREPAPPLPCEPVPPPPPPPPGDQQTKKPFSFKMGASPGEPSQAETSGTSTPTKQGFSFNLGKKKGGTVMQFGVKSKPVKGAASAFAESSGEEEEEEEMPEEDTRLLSESDQLTSTPTQQQDTLEKVIEYADTLRIKAALKPKLLIRFVRGTEQGGILPGTIPTSQTTETMSETTDVKKRSFKEIKEPRHSVEREDSGDSGKQASVEVKKRSFKERKEYKRHVDSEDSGSSGNEAETKNRTTKNDGKQRSLKERGEPRHKKDKDRKYYDKRARNSPSKDCKDGKGSGDRRSALKDSREDDYKYKQSKEYKDRKDSKRKGSRDREDEKYDYNDSKDDRRSRKSSSKKKHSKIYEEKREFRECWENSSPTEKKEQRT